MRSIVNVIIENDGIRHWCKLVIGVTKKYLFIYGTCLLPSTVSPQINNRRAYHTITRAANTHVRTYVRYVFRAIQISTQSHKTQCAQMRKNMMKQREMFGSISSMRFVHIRCHLPTNRHQHHLHTHTHTHAILPHRQLPKGERKKIRREKPPLEPDVCAAYIKTNNEKADEETDGKMQPQKSIVAFKRAENC